MKKRILLFSSVGAIAGLLYVLESNLRKQKGNEKAANAKSGKEPGAKPPVQTTLRTPASTSKSSGSSRRDTSTPESATAGRAGDGTQHLIDDHGTDQLEASLILKTIRDNAFDASDEKLALALGRPTEEIEQWTTGNGLIDGDVVMKARALAMQRGLEVE
jgi:hypothetical protein